MPRPLLAASVAFVAGVALGAWLPQERAAWCWATGVTLVLWTTLLLGGRPAAARRMAIATFVVVGIWRIQEDLSPLYAVGDPVAEGDAVASGRVARPAELRDGGLTLHLEEGRLRRHGQTFALGRPLQVVVAGAGGGAAYAVGDRITARGRVRVILGDRNLGWFPGPAAPLGRRYAGRLIVDSPAWIRREGHDAGRGPNALVLRWRAAADSFWKRRPGAAAQILNSLTTGERAGIPAEVQEAFLRSGTTHLLAISGMNVGFLAAAVFLALKRALALLPALALRFPVQPMAAALTLPALWFFMLFSGNQIPVGRAVLMSAAGLAAVILWRRVDAGDALALAGLAIVARDPRALFSASFQLSFVAVAALGLVAPRLRECPSAHGDAGGAGRRLGRGARALLLASLAASAATAPLVAFHFQQVSLVGPIANLAAVPFTGFVVLPAGWLALGAAAIGGHAAEGVSRLALWSADGLVGVATWFAAPAWACIRTARPPALLTLGVLAMAAALLPPAAESWRRAGVAACVASALAATWWALAIHRPELFIAFLDVGQGLSAVARLPGGDSLLYDAGPRWRDYDAGERVVVPALRRLGITRVDTLAISHRHPDHDGGVEAVRRDLGVGRIWAGGDGRSPPRGCTVAYPGGAVIRVLGPPPAAAGRVAPAPDENDRSLALLVELGSTGGLFTGDAGPTVVASLAQAASPSPRHIVLQAPHHGGSPEACRVLGATLRPEVSVVSVGRNTYGHPRPKAVEALQVHGRVLRTDRDGAVFVRSDGRRLDVRTWRELATGRTWGERLRWLAAGW